MATNGYKNNRAFVSAAPGAWAKIAASDFGVAAPAAPTLVLEAGSGAWEQEPPLWKFLGSLPKVFR
jgi:hypothetical protein